MMVLSLCAVVPGEGQSSAEAVDTGELRLIYVFNPRVDVHLERALQVQSLVRSAPIQISALGVIRGYMDDNTPLGRGDRTIEFRTVSEGAAKAQRIAGEGVISWLSRSPGLREDHFVLEDATGVHLQGMGSELDQLDALVAPAVVATKVEFNTWGKVKELFR